MSQRSRHPEAGKLCHRQQLRALSEECLLHPQKLAVVILQALHEQPEVLPHRSKLVAELQGGFGSYLSPLAQRGQLECLVQSFFLYLASAARFSFTVEAYWSTYSWPLIFLSSYIISSVTARKTMRSPSMPSNLEKSKGLP